MLDHGRSRSSEGPGERTGTAYVAAEEIAVGNVILRDSFDRAPVYGGVHCGIVGRSNDQKIAVQI